MTLDRAITAIVTGVLMWAATYFGAAAPAKQQASHAQERWAHWKGLNEEKRDTLSNLRARVEAAEAYCGARAEAMEEQR